jgi:hypothetical protein
MENKEMNNKKEDCVENIANIIEKYFELNIEDISKISGLVDEMIKESNIQQEKENLANEINGESR